MLATAPRRWGPIKSLLALSPVLLGAPLYAVHYQYSQYASVHLSILTHRGLTILLLFVALPTPLTEQCGLLLLYNMLL